MRRIARAWPALFALLLCGCAASRPPEVELEQAVGALRLQAGMSVADVGAGDGEWSEALARRVGSAGHVFATEVDADDLEGIRRRMDAAELANVTTILGGENETGLPDNCCDAIWLRLVYHHFIDPPTIVADLRRALKPGGRLVVVEITPQKGWPRLEGVPERDGHGISPEDLLEEMSRMQPVWTIDLREDDWGDNPDHYGIVFR